MSRVLITDTTTNRSLTGLCVVSLFAALAACSPSAPPATAPSQEAAVPVPPATPMEPAVDAAKMTADFVTKAANTDMLEIATSKVALNKSTNADVKKFAQTMVTDHTKTMDQLKDWAKTANAALPAAADSDTQGKIDNIANADAQGFDDKYLDTVIDAHEKGIEAFSDYSKSGADPVLQKWATDTLPVLQDHFVKAKALRDAVNRS